MAAYESTWQHERRGHIRCHTLGHAWDDCDSNWTPMWGLPLTVRCQRCGTERRDKVDRHTGAVLPGGRHYVYPAGYRLGRGEEKPTRADFRLMLLAIRNEGQSKRKSGRAS